ncbi:MAG TPA: bifunctional lytic transglycosylase/C40 family peptidase [Streptosporangiaceae bacterium]
MLRWLAAAAFSVAIPAVPLVLLAAVAGAGDDAPGMPGGPSALALSSIPPAYLALYLAAARTCPGLPWSVLAGIGRVESDHGRSHAPGVHSGSNPAGAEGPMQFELATFARYAVNAGRPARLSPYNLADAVFTAAAMLCADGAGTGTPAGIREALAAYDHSRGYVRLVLTWAARYTVPAAPAAAATAIAFALAQVGKPYQWGATGPSAYDCSGLVYAAYAAAGISIGRTTFQWRQDGPRVPLTELRPGDLIFYPGSDGTRQNPGHVVMYLGGGQVVQAPRTGEDVQVDPLYLAGAVVATRPADLPRHA